MGRTESTGLHLLARALLLAVGPAETARVLRDEFGWDTALLTLAELTEPQAPAALWTVVADGGDRPGRPPSSSPHAG
jgi:hypothetical protein